MGQVESQSNVFEYQLDRGDVRNQRKQVGTLLLSMSVGDVFILDCWSGIRQEDHGRYRARAADFANYVDSLKLTLLREERIRLERLSDPGSTDTSVGGKTLYWRVG